MVILPQDQIDSMVKIMDYMFKYPRVSVYDVKQRFSLDDYEYEMIFDLTMPLIREANIKKYWYTKYRGLVRKIEEFERDSDLSDKDFKKEVIKLINEKSYAEDYMEKAVGYNDDEELEEEIGES